MKHRTFVAIVTVGLTAVSVLAVGDAVARVSGGGSRGSRSYSAPVRPSPSPATPSVPSSPSRSYTTPSRPPTPVQPMPQRPSFFRNIMTGIAGFAIGGLIGSLLFGGLHGGFGGFGGIGMFDLLLIGGAVVLLVMFLRRRKADRLETAYAGSTAPSYTGYDAGNVAAAPAAEPVADAAPSDLDQGLAHIRQMDPMFDPVIFAERARAEFANVQSVLATRDVSVLRDRLGGDMYASLARQCNELRDAGRTNHIQNIDLERAEVTEAWQESGQDFVTVYFAGTVIDYTVDDRSGAVVQGSKTEPQKVEEFWTFTRPVGPNRWKVSAIQPA